MSFSKEYFTELTIAQESKANNLSLITPDQNGKVQARNLYQFLGLNTTQLSRWFKTNIEKNEFALEGSDYWTLDIMSNGNETKDFDLLPEFAEELCMLAKNKQGKKARLFYIECRKKVQKEIQPQSTDIVDQSIAMANQVLELAHKLRDEREAKRLVQVQLDHKQEIILDLTDDIPPKQMRATINEVVRWDGSEGYGSRWHRLYKQFKYHYGVDIAIRAKNRKMKKLDYAEQNNLLTNLYKLALELFEKDNPNINQSQLQLA